MNDDELCLIEERFERHGAFVGYVCADIPRLIAEVLRLRGALDRDKTGLATALNACKKEIESRSWILDGRGSYEWDDQRYRDEARLAFEAVIRIIDAALRESGAIADAALEGKEATRG